MRKWWSHRWCKLTAAALLAVAALTLFDRAVFPLPADRLTRPHARFIYSRDRHLLAAFASRDLFWRRPVSLDRVSPRLIESVIAVEDRWFYYHPGVNPVSLLAATYDNVRAGRVVRGGSTITMQIARMIEPKGRTFAAKLIEILRAFQLELRYSKDELLEIYFNLVPYGGNIEGVGAATHFYFDKDPSRLTWSEAAILAAIPASPNAYRPDLNPDRCRARRDTILTRLAAHKLFDSAEFSRACLEEIPRGRLDRPFIAPHFAQMMIDRCPDSTTLHTTIDLNIQILCERLASRYHGALESRGIHNLAVVVLDNATADLVALVGSPDFRDRAHDGQVNGAVARRSPGSALKPFVYTLAFDDGLVTPQSRLDDIPVSYAGYSPENYDEQYHGVVSVSDALINSFNVPAVNLAYQVGLRRIHKLFNDGGLGLKRNYFDYGLPLVLGAGEVTLLDLSALYSSLARGGIYLTPTFLADHPLPEGKRLFSEGAAWLTTDILSNLQRPDFPASWEFTRDRPAVAWKTGTSFGRKDAWTVGYTPRYTVAVWVGNFDGLGSPYLVGAETAAPLAFEILDELMRGQDPVWFGRPDQVGVRQVCASSGMPPCDHCPATVADYYLRDRSSVQPCTVHRTLLVDHATGYSLCRACAPGHTIDTLVFQEWPARLSGWLRNQDAAIAAPTHNPLCTGEIITDLPVIASPEPDQIFDLIDDLPAEYQKIPFKGSVAPSSGRIHWFLDNRLFTSADPGLTVFYSPTLGRHTLMAVDEFGRSQSLCFTVQ